MEPFELVYPRSFEKDLRRLDKTLLKIVIKKIQSLALDPHPQQSKKLQGTRDTYRLRIGDYRVIYQIDFTNKTILINHIRHRSEVYR